MDNGGRVSNNYAVIPVSGLEMGLGTASMTKVEEE